MASVKDTASFFTRGNSKQFEYVLKLYPQVLKLKAEKRTKKPEELIRLDDWYQNELPKMIKQRGKDAHLVHEELVQAMKWKQSRGKFYPQLSYLIKVNTPRAVMAETKKAFKKLPNLEQALTALSNLKGVGTTMASALLAAAAPEMAPFMADECLMAIPEIEGIDYTTKEYLNFVTHIQATVDRLNTEHMMVMAAAANAALAAAATAAAEIKTKNNSTILNNHHNHNNNNNNNNNNKNKSGSGSSSSSASSSSSTSSSSSSSSSSEASNDASDSSQPSSTTSSLLPSSTSSTTTTTTTVGLDEATAAAIAAAVAAETIMGLETGTIDLAATSTTETNEVTTSTITSDLATSTKKIKNSSAAASISSSSPTSSSSSGKPIANSVDSSTAAAAAAAAAASVTSSWSPHRVELAVWTHYVANELQPELLDEMPEGDAIGIIGGTAGTTVLCGTGTNILVNNNNNNNNNSDSNSNSNNNLHILNGNTSALLEQSDESNLEPPTGLLLNDNNENGLINFNYLSSKAGLLESLDDSTRSEDSMEKPVTLLAVNDELNTDSDSQSSAKRSLDCDSSESQTDGVGGIAVGVGGVDGGGGVGASRCIGEPEMKRLKNFE